MIDGKRRVPDFTDVVSSDLRALLLWATVGVRRMRGGAYEREIGHIIECYSKDVRFKFKPPIFAADLKDVYCATPEKLKRPKPTKGDKRR